ncbi:hypothetical protein [Cupriavidus sp. AcVe19-6a]|uniref:hypothetical protein n=1 Tax=Cupriavidus sp. AcVe19-6a TaxID=2821358 RepID=UPI001AE15CA3|nr:hypothetical protein [Cupriavidus sp. AcVe19-6a]MBP0635526.1 hypothetical protein [Cupriavidus sp. AcVe19-6a]
MGKVVKSKRDLRTLIDQVFRQAAMKGEFDEHENLAAFKAQHGELSKQLALQLGDLQLLDLFRAAAKRHMTVPVEPKHAKQLTLSGIPDKVPGCIKFVDPNGKRRFVSTMLATVEQLQSHARLQRANIEACENAATMSGRLCRFIKKMGARNLEEALRISAARKGGRKDAA